MIPMKKKMGNDNQLNRSNMSGASMASTDNSDQLHTQYKMHRAAEPSKPQFDSNHPTSSLGSKKMTDKNLLNNSTLTVLRHNRPLSLTSPVNVVTGF